MLLAAEEVMGRPGHQRAMVARATERVEVKDLAAVAVMEVAAGRWVAEAA